MLCENVRYLIAPEAREGKRCEPEVLLGLAGFKPMLAAHQAGACDSQLSQALLMAVKQALLRQSSKLSFGQHAGEPCAAEFRRSWTEGLMLQKGMKGGPVACRPHTHAGSAPDWCR